MARLFISFFVIIFIFFYHIVDLFILSALTPSLKLDKLPHVLTALGRL